MPIFLQDVFQIMGQLGVDIFKLLIDRLPLLVYFCELLIVGIAKSHIFMKEIQSLIEFPVMGFCDCYHSNLNIKLLSIIYFLVISS